LAQHPQHFQLRTSLKSSSISKKTREIPEEIQFRERNSKIEGNLEAIDLDNN
jgi:hypothetical protein